MTQALHKRTIRLIPILMLLAAVALVVPAMAAAPVFEQIDPITADGAATKTVTLNFSTPVWWGSPLLDGEANAIVVKVAGATRVVEEIGPREYEDASKLLDVTFSGPAIEDWQSVSVKITDCGAKKIREAGPENSTMSGSRERSATCIFPPVFEEIQFVPECGGTNIKLHFDKTVWWDTALNSSHITVTVDGVPVDADVGAPSWTSTMTLVLSRPITEEGQVVNVTITDAGAAEIRETNLYTPMAGGVSVERTYAEPPKFTKIQVTNAETGEITLYFNKPVYAEQSLYNTYYGTTDVKAMVDGKTRSITAITHARSTEDATDTIIVKVYGPMITEGQVVEISITADDAKKIKEAVGGMSMLGGKTQSVTHAATDKPILVKAKTDELGNSIIAEFDRNMANQPDQQIHFKFVVDGEERNFNTYYLDGSNKKRVILGVSGTPIWGDDTVNLTYTPGSVAAEDGGLLEAFDERVVNVIRPVFVQIEPITADGAATKTITLSFNKPVWWSSPLLDGEANAIVVKVAGDTRVVKEIGPRGYEDASKLLNVTFSGPAIEDWQAVSVTITDCGAKKIKETSPENNTMSGRITESATYILPPVFKEIQFMPECGGTNIVLYFDRVVGWDTPLNSTHITVTVDGAPVEFADVGASSWTSTMTLVLSRPITEEGQVVNVTITDAGAAEIRETGLYTPMAGGASVEQTYAEPPKFTEIQVTDAEAGEITLYFNKTVYAGQMLTTADIKAMVDGKTRSITDITSARSTEGATDTITVKLYDPMITEDQVVEISITADGARKIKEIVGGMSMLGGKTQSVTHTATSKPKIVRAWIDEFGEAIAIEFNVNIVNQPGQLNQFKFVVDGEEKSFNTYRQDGDNKRRIVLGVLANDTIRAGDTVNLTYTPGSVAAEDGGLLEALNERIENKKRPILTDVAITKVADGGNEIELQFDEPVYWNKELVGGSDIKVTVAGGAREVVNIDNRTAKNADDRLTVTVKGAEITEGQSVVVTVTKSGAEKIVSNNKPLIECTSSTQYKVYHGGPYIEGISLVDHVGKEIWLHFSEYVSWGELVDGTHITIEVDGTTRRAYKVNSGSGYSLSIKFDGDIIKVGQMIDVSITGDGAKAISATSGHGALAPEYEHSITFKKIDGPVIKTAETNEYGNMVYITFDKALKSSSDREWMSPNGFEIYTDNGWYCVPIQDAWLENGGKTLVFAIYDDHFYHYLWPQLIKPDDELSISYEGECNRISSEDGGILAGFERHPVENKVTKTFDQIQPLYAGWNLVSAHQWVNTSASEFVYTDLVYKYDAVTGFSSAGVKDIEPVEALYVKTSRNGWLAANFEDFGDSRSHRFSTKKLSEGWNLISVGTPGSADALLSPLRFIQVGQVEGTGIATLVSQGALNRISWDLYLPTLTERDWDNLHYETLSPVDGYWIYMNGGKDFGVFPGEWDDCHYHEWDVHRAST